jgi:hypothetical protein
MLAYIFGSKHLRSAFRRELFTVYFLQRLGACDASSCDARAAVAADAAFAAEAACVASFSEKGFHDQEGG